MYAWAGPPVCAAMTWIQFLGYYVGVEGLAKQRRFVTPDEAIEMGIFKPGESLVAQLNREKREAEALARQKPRDTPQARKRRAAKRRQRKQDRQARRMRKHGD